MKEIVIFLREVPRNKDAPQIKACKTACHTAKTGGLQMKLLPRKSERSEGKKIVFSNMLEPLDQTMSQE